MKSRRKDKAFADGARSGEKLGFLRLYFGKVHRLIAVNVIYFIVVLPLLAFTCIEIQIALVSLRAVKTGAGLFSSLFVLLPTGVNYALLLLSALLYGPMKMGVAHTYYSFASERHSWFTELFTEAVRNARQGLIFGLLDVAVVGTTLTFIAAATVTGLENPSNTLRALSLLAAFALAFYLSVRRYFYLQAVTVKLGVWHIIKNSFILSVVSLGRNALACVAVAAVWLVSMAIDWRLSALLVPFFTYSLAGFTSVYMAVPVLRKYLLRASGQEKHNE